MQVTAASAAKHAWTNGFHCQASPSSAACASHEAAERVRAQSHLNGRSLAEHRQGEELAKCSAAPLLAGQPHAAAPAAAVQPRAPLMGRARGTAGARPASAEDNAQGKSSTEDGRHPFQGVLLPDSSVSRAESSEENGAIQASEEDEQQRNSSGQHIHVSHRGELANNTGKAHVAKRRDRQRPDSAGAAQRGSEVATQRAKRRADSCPEPPAKKSKCQEAFTLPDYGSSSSCSRDSASLTPEQGAQPKAEACSSEQMSAHSTDQSESAAADIRPGSFIVEQALQTAATSGLPPAEPMHEHVQVQQVEATAPIEAPTAAQLPSTGACAGEDACMAEACEASTSSQAGQAQIQSLGALTADSTGADAAAAKDAAKASGITAQEPSSLELEGNQSPVAVRSAAVRQPVAELSGPASAAPEQGDAPAIEKGPILSAASSAPAAELETGAALADALEFPGADPEGAVASEDSPLRPAPGPYADTEASVPAADTEADAAAAAAAAAGQQPGSAADHRCLHESAHTGLAGHPGFDADSSYAIPQEPMVVALRSDGTQICVSGVRCSFLLTPRRMHC